MQALLKQTIKQALAVFFLAFPLCLSAWNDPLDSRNCDSVIKYITENLVAPTSSEAASICEYLKLLNYKTSEHCPIPQDLEAVVNRNNVNLSWERNALADTYIVKALNVNTGRESSDRTPNSSYTFLDLEPGLYLFSVQSNCGDSGSSPAAITSSIIIGDIAIIRPNEDPECVCTNGTLHYAGGAAPPQLVIPWENEGFCEYGIYEISMIINSVHYAQLEVTYQYGNSIAVVDLCRTKKMKISNNTYTIFGTDPTGNNIVELEFSGDYGIILNPQVSLYSYDIQVKFCCSQRNPGETDSKAEQRDHIFSLNSGASDLQLKSYPNPFDQNTTIDFYTSKDTEASLILYNSQGQAVRQLFNGQLAIGQHQTILQADDLAPGLYYLRMRTADREELLKMIKL